MLLLDRASGIFWGSVIVLFGLAAFYGISAKKEIDKVRGAEGKIESSSIVKLVRIVDGDTIVVAQEGQNPASVRILGVKSFDAKIEKDIVTPYSQAAIDTLDRLMSNKPARVMLHTTPKDRYGRYIAAFYVDDQDIGLKLVKEGLVLVYTVYPFAAMSLYLQEQEVSRAARRGLWANKDVSSRALALIREWQRKTE
jgi:micrococcal nuclease